MESTTVITMTRMNGKQILYFVNELMLPRELFYCYFLLREDNSLFYEEKRIRSATFNLSLLFGKEDLWVNWKIVFRLNS